MFGEPWIKEYEKGVGSAEYVYAVDVWWRPETQTSDSQIDMTRHMERGVDGYSETSSLTGTNLTMIERMMTNTPLGLG